MRPVKTVDLIGVDLDWVVAKCLGKTYLPYTITSKYFFPSTNWQQGGPIIHDAGISITQVNPGAWKAFPGQAEKYSIIAEGPTPLIAAMRCFVYIKFGNIVNIPL